MLPNSIKAIVIGNKGPLAPDELLMGESMKALEFAIYSELQECMREFARTKNSEDTELTSIIVELQCALDILQCARTEEERIKVYEILKNIGKFP